MTVPITHQIAELEAVLRERQSESAKPGKGQELARLRLERTQAALTTLVWCRDNSERIRAARAAGETE